MSYLYVNEDGVVVSIEGNRCIAKYKDGMIKYMPIEALEGIVIMGRSQLTTYCMEQCLERGINVSFFSKGGRYFGRLHSTGHVKTDRQRRHTQVGKHRTVVGTLLNSPGKLASSFPTAAMPSPN